MNRVVLGIRRRIWCHILAAIFSLTIVAPLVYLAADRNPVLTIYETKIYPNPVAADENLTITWDAVVHRRCDGIIRRQMIRTDGIITDYAAAPVVFRAGTEIGRRTTYSRIFTAPRPGIYTHVAHVERWCNPLQYWVPFFRIHEKNETGGIVVRQ